MSQDSDNVVYPRFGQDAADDLPVPVEDLAETVGAIGRCLDKIDPEPELASTSGAMKVTPLLLQMSVVEERLQELADIRVTTWQDVGWALHFSDARVRALASIQESVESLDRKSVV